MTFLDIRFIDLVDIFLVAFLFYEIYKWIKGTVALNIFFGLFAFVITWLLVKALNMELLGSILDNLVSVGVIAILILFQEEIRRGLNLLGSRHSFSQWFSLEKILSKNAAGMMNIYVSPIVKACLSMGKGRTGALIIIAKDNELVDYVKTGELINGVISEALIESIFYKNNPLHDGAMIIVGNKIKAARCILPVSHNTDVPEKLGLRHRAGLGIAQATDAMVIIVSEETGKISYAHQGKLYVDISSVKLTELLKKD